MMNDIGLTVAIILPYVLIVLCFLRYRRLLIKMSEITAIFDVVDTPAEAFEHREKPIDKRQALKEAIRKGKQHLLPKKCTESFVDKASDEVIEKAYAEFVQREIHEKGEKTAKALSSHAISMYAKAVGNVVQLDSAEGLKKDIEEDPIIKDSMADLGILVYSAFGKFLAPLLVAAHTINHTQLSVKHKTDKERDDEHQEENGEESDI